jgi:DNA polymerase-1
LSSSKPNLQNLTRKDRIVGEDAEYTGGADRGEKHNLRYGLIPRPGNTFISVDHSQQEVRFLAIVAKEKTLLEAIQGGVDIHRQTAKLVWGNMDDTHRQWAKQLNFAVVYGLSSGGLAEKLGLSRDKSEKLLSDYFNRFPGIKPFLKTVERQCAQHGLARYWSGRIWREEDSNFFYRAPNAVISGGSADIISIAAMRLQKYLDEVGAGNVVSIVHDELILEIPEERVEEVAPQVSKIMEVEDLFGVPFANDLKCGNSYGSFQKLEQWKAART